MDRSTVYFLCCERVYCRKDGLRGDGSVFPEWNKHRHSAGIENGGHKELSRRSVWRRCVAATTTTAPFANHAFVVPRHSARLGSTRSRRSWCLSSPPPKSSGSSCPGSRPPLPRSWRRPESRWARDTRVPGCHFFDGRSLRYRCFSPQVSRATVTLRACYERSRLSPDARGVPASVGRGTLLSSSYGPDPPNPGPLCPRTTC